MNRQGFLKKAYECRRDCCVPPSRSRSETALRWRSTLRCPRWIRLSASSMCRCRMACFIGHLTGHRWKAGHFLLDRTSDRSPFLL